MNNIDLINRKEVLNFLEKDYGFWEYIKMIAPRIGIDETEAIELADEVRITIKDTIESMPADEERKVKVNIYRDFTGDYIRTHYTCMKCHKTAISADEEEMFFCPFCGEKFEEVE